MHALAGSDHPEKTMRKIQQIAIAWIPEVRTPEGIGLCDSCMEVVALCDDGTLWSTQIGQREWWPLHVPPIPQEN
jgi:hypothetical protein